MPALATGQRWQPIDIFIDNQKIFYKTIDIILQIFPPGQVSLVKGNGIKELKAEADYAPEATGKVAIVARARDGAARPEFSVTYHPCFVDTFK